MSAVLHEVVGRNSCCAVSDVVVLYMSVIDSVGSYVELHQFPTTLDTLPA